MGAILTTQAKLCLANVHPTNALVLGGIGAPNQSRSWSNRILGAIFAIVIPFAFIKWVRALTIKNENNNGIEKSETEVKIVDKVANEASEIVNYQPVDELPEEKVKTITYIIENVANHTANNANMTHQFVEKENEFGLVSEVHEIAKKVTQADETTKIDDDHGKYVKLTDIPEVIMKDDDYQPKQENT